jgi:ribonucrease Y
MWRNEMSGLDLLVQLIIALVIAAIAFALGYVLQRYQSESRLKSAQAQAEHVLSEADSNAKDQILKAKDEAIRMRGEAEREINQRRREIQRIEERIQARQEANDRKAEQIELRDRRLSERQSQMDKRFNKLEEMELARKTELERISGLSSDDAKALLLQTVETEARNDMARVIREVEGQAREEGEKKAREIISLAIERVASDQVSETTVTSVALPSDEMKGRIIGRQGRNIRAIENATGVDLVVDDTPEAILISCFDPVRREVARMALSKLVLDGRIHPARIEKEVEKAREEVERIIREEGERAVIETGLQGLHPEIVKLVGRLKFRTSYGQNQHAHAIETAHLAGILAVELGADVKSAKMGGLLHDLGKAVSHEQEGPHALVGADIARRYGVPAKVCNIIASHHGEEESESIEVVLVTAADAISGARPGARRESIETYIKRVQALEDVANSFPGVAQSFAIQAGREVRIIVKPGEIDDLATIQLSKNIAKKVEESLEYPGQIKVTVIRETRSVDYAK